jgi:hypothetical protein
MHRVALALLLAGFVTAAACGRDRAASDTPLPADRAGELLINRNWMDRWPSQESDRLHVYRFTPSMGGGVFQDRTLFAGHFELFTYQVDGEHLTIQWPHSKEEDRMVFRIREVNGPAPFDLLLELSTPSRGPRTYYGRSVEGSAAADPFALPAL